MTDQIAPSLATELEQAAKEAHVCTMRGLCEASSERREADKRLSALLTRAAALARAAEKVTEKWPEAVKAQEPIYTSAFIHGVKYSGPQIGEEMAELRALVSSEGKEK